MDTLVKNVLQWNASDFNSVNSNQLPNHVSKLRISFYFTIFFHANICWCVKKFKHKNAHKHAARVVGKMDNAI